MGGVKTDSNFLNKAARSELLKIARDGLEELDKGWSYTPVSEALLIDNSTLRLCRDAFADRRRRSTVFRCGIDLFGSAHSLKPRRRPRSRSSLQAAPAAADWRSRAARATISAHHRSPPQRASWVEAPERLQGVRRAFVGLIKRVIARLAARIGLERALYLRHAGDSLVERGVGADPDSRHHGRAEAADIEAGDAVQRQAEDVSADLRPEIGPRTSAGVKQPRRAAARRFVAGVEQQAG